MATKLNLLIDQGAEFIATINLNDESGGAVDISSYDGRAQIRKHYTSSNAVNMTVATSNTGTITLSLTSSQTDDIVAGRYVYDVELVDASNNVSRIVEGIVTVTPNVTR